jgi:hypothetical protein
MEVRTPNQLLELVLDDVDKAEKALRESIRTPEERARLAAFCSALRSQANAAVSLNPNDSAARGALESLGCAIQNTPKLAVAFARCAALGLTPGGPRPEIWLVPRQTKGEWGIEAWVSHTGIVKLLRAEGEFLKTFPVYAGDTFDLVHGMIVGHRGHHAGMPGERGKIVGFGVWHRLLQGSVVVDMGAHFVPMDVLEKRAAMSKGPVRAKWGDEMDSKTAIQYCWARGWLPLPGGISDALTEEWEGMMQEERTHGEVVPVRRLVDSGPVQDLRADLARFNESRPEPVEVRPETQPSAAQSAQKSEFEALSRELFGEVAAKSRSADGRLVRVRLSDGRSTEAEVGPDGIHAATLAALRALRPTLAPEWGREGEE